MRRLSVGLRSAALIFMIGSGLQLASGSPAYATTHAPGLMQVAPISVNAGSPGNTLTFVYSPVSRQLVSGILRVTIPTGWSQPLANGPGSSGSVRASTGTLSVLKRTIIVKNLTLCKSCSLTITYSDTTAPTAAGTSNFPTKVAKSAATALEPLATPPHLVVEPQTCVPSAVTTTGPPSLTADPGTCLDHGTVVTLTGSGYDRSSLGSVSECNDDPSQPTVYLGGVLNETVPVSCSGFSVATAQPTTSSGDIPAGLTFTIISPIPGPPCGPGYLIATCPTDSSGGDAATDAAKYPCPPTAAQQSIGDSCILFFSDMQGKSQSVDISFVASP
jgi:hypothetical protein